MLSTFQNVYQRLYESLRAETLPWILNAAKFIGHKFCENGDIGFPVCFVTSHCLRDQISCDFKSGISKSVASNLQRKFPWFLIY